MSTLESILQWTQDDLAEWQNDAVRRFMTQGEFTKHDKAEILTMLKARHGLIDLTRPTPKPQLLKRSDISGIQQMSETVTLKAIQDLCNVNAIPDGSHMLFGHQGLTVVYGENGSGKSAYARVLKKACKARDKNEKILPNAFGKAVSSPAKATIKISVNNNDDLLSWQDGQGTSDILSSICVFDSRCARIIVDDNNEPMYLPYGADVFPGLVDLLKEFKTQLEEEKPKPEKLEYSDIPAATKAGQFVLQLSHETPLDIVDKETTWAEENELRLKALLKDIAIAETLDPTTQTQRSRNLKDGLDAIIDHIRRVDCSLSEANVNSIQEAISTCKTLEGAVEIASTESFAREPLLGVGGNPWRVLYEAARDYSIKVAYPGQDFPVLDSKALCVLCMQPLQEDGKARMQRFKDFMEGNTKKELDAAKADLQAKRTDLEQIMFPPIEIVKSVVDEISSRNEPLAKQLEEYLSDMQDRYNQLIQAIADNEVGTFPPPKPISIDCFVKVSAQLEEEAKHIEKTAQPAELSASKVVKDELQARKLLSQKKQEIREYISQLGNAVKYDECIAELGTRQITEKGKAIISAALTGGLKNALLRELQILNASYLPLNLKPSGVEGETRHKMELSGSCLRADLSEILSEGERCVVAIAGFLAELGTREHKFPIVLDDPICSLDGVYRDRVAGRLAEEARNRQVIVFTHDLPFLLKLQEDVIRLGGSFYAQTVRRLGNIPGNCKDGLPWHGKFTQERIKYLSNELVSFEDLYGENREEYNQKASSLYELMRETWEAGVEEVLLNSTIRRHIAAVQIRRLDGVTVTDEDYKVIRIGIANCSNWVHDKSKALNVDRPAPDEIRKDIDNLEAFFKDVKDRSALLTTKRKEIFKPKQSDAG
jgi:energy-coupling factor transporter ATP-binding protein EcfA2